MEKLNQASLLLWEINKYLRLLDNIFRIALILIALMQSFGVQKVIAVDTAAFRGQVFDVEGNAVKVAEIFIYNSPDTRRPADFISGRTDDDGHFTMTLPSGKYWAVARLRRGDKYGPLMVGDKHSGEPVDIWVKADRELEMNFKVADIRDAASLTRKTREDYLRMSGRVVDKNGMPIQMYYVIADRKGRDTSLNPLLTEGGDSHLNEMSDFISSWSDEAGHYALYLPKGKYIIGYTDKFPPRSYSIYKELIIESGKDNFDIVVEVK
ncbi:MAG: carboxypeptidase regulatory-like domain-containing protein [Nitrospirae bacterium]|nr:carboxypeptidase regulatory-like domain-containing protein [Nitrospirota bacterium]